MSNALKYIKDLEAAGFARSQAEAQVQMVLDVLEGDLVTKSDLKVLEEKIDNRFVKVDARFVELESRMDKRFALIDSRFTELQSRIDKRFAEFELRIVSRLGLLTISCLTISTAIIGWLVRH